MPGGILAVEPGHQLGDDDLEPGIHVPKVVPGLLGSLFDLPDVPRNEDGQDEHHHSHCKSQDANNGSKACQRISSALHRLTLRFPPDSGFPNEPVGGVTEHFLCPAMAGGRFLIKDIHSNKAIVEVT